MLADDIYDLGCFNGHASDAPDSGRYPSLDMDHADKDTVDSNSELDPEDSAMDALRARAPRPQLRSRPPIDFYRQNSVTNCTPSLMSGSTLHTNAPAFPPKIIDTHANTLTFPPKNINTHANALTFPPKVIDSPPRLPPSVIASLTVAELYHNPHYCELRERYDYVTGVLASHMDRDSPSITKGNIPVPDIRRCTYFLFLVSRHALNEALQLSPALPLHVDSHRPHMSTVGFNSANSFVSPSLDFANNANSHASHVSSPLGFADNDMDSHEMSSLGPGNTNSRTSSSLGPSDSASQCTPSDPDQISVERLLKLVEAPSKRPLCVHPSVLWYSSDCITDKTAGDIVTEANKHRPKTHLILRHEDGTILSSAEHDNVQMSADIFATRLIALARKDRQLCPPGSKLPTKTNVKKWFKPEYSQFLLELEAEQPYLRLCSAHWKADNFIGQAFLRQSDSECKRRAREASSMPGPQKQCDPAPAPSIPVSSVVPINMAKRALELSPGPKSPSASHAQKRSKDEAKNSGQNNKDHLVAPSNRMYSLC